MTRKEEIMAMQRLVDAEYVRESLGVSRASAYRIIRDLNREFEASGVRTLAGKVSLAFFEQRFFAMPGKGVEDDGRQPRP